MYQENFIPRMVEGATPLLVKGFDLYKLLTDDAVCLNDTQSLKLVERMLVDASTIISTLIGFEGTYGKLRASSEVKSIDQMGDDLNNAIEAYEKLHANDPPQISYFDQVEMTSF